MTGIRPAAISEIANNQRSTINKDQIEKIVEVLNISNLSDLIVFELESELASMSHPYNQLKDKKKRQANKPGVLSKTSIGSSYALRYKKLFK